MISYCHNCQYDSEVLCNFITVTCALLQSKNELWLGGVMQGLPVYLEYRIWPWISYCWEGYCAKSGMGSKESRQPNIWWIAIFPYNFHCKALCVYSIIHRLYYWPVIFSQDKRRWGNDSTAVEQPPDHPISAPLLLERRGQCSPPIYINFFSLYLKLLTFVWLDIKALFLSPDIFSKQAVSACDLQCLCTVFTRQVW